jgi:hypothetical protein
MYKANTQIIVDAIDRIQAMQFNETIQQQLQHPQQHVILAHA